MSATDTRHGPGLRLETKALWTTLIAIASTAGYAWASTRLARFMTGADTDLPANPFALLIGLGSGRISWGRAEWTSLGVLLGATVLVLLVIAASWRARSSGRPLVDKAARHLAGGREVAAFTAAGASRTAKRLGAADAGPGLPIGRTVVGDRPLYSSWEDVCVDIWGPRTGKTTARAIPAILAAPGAVLVTSNKRDIVDATRGPRTARGQVWVFDPQQIIDEPARWWWNPLSYVTDEARARTLADLFATGSRETGAKTDAFFDSAGRDLLSGLLLAAALARRPITQVYEWLCAPGDDEPVEVLTDAGHPLTAGAVSAAVNAPDKQRAGVYATAQQAVSFLTNRAALPWITQTSGSRPQLDVARFVEHRSTLYAVSKEGRGTLGPLVAALTVAVTEAAEALAKRSPGGRLPVPMVTVLDEAANVCRWPDLPDLYSHYGSRGIVMMTILQSWSQGVQVWGREGMRKLWSAANVRVYGGGVGEVEFLSELAQIVGEYQRDEHSRTDATTSGASTTYSLRSQRVLDVADLAAMPRGRALVIASGSRPVLVRTQPWTQGPHAAAVRASIAAHDHGHRPTAKEGTP